MSDIYIKDQNFNGPELSINLEISTVISIEKKLEFLRELEKLVDKYYL